MADELTGDARTGYRTSIVLLFVGLTSIGFTRFEDRALLGVPGSPASAMAAMALSEEGEAESYSEAPEDSVSLNNISRAPTDRIRRILRDRDVLAGAARQISDRGAPGNAFVAGVQDDASADPAAGLEFASLDSIPAAFASLAPPVPGQGTAVFNAPLAGDGGGSGGGGGSVGGGVGSGGGDPPPPPPPAPVSPIPEPATWMMLIWGLFGIGAVLRRRGKRVVSHAVDQLS